jgi:hypothetical protein
MGATMMTNKTPTIFKIVIPDELGAMARVIVERGDLSVLLSFEVDDLALPAAYETMIAGLTQLAALEENPPADIQIPEPAKPAPAQTPKKPAATKTPAASKPTPPKQLWWTHQETGAIEQHPVSAVDPKFWLGPFESKADAEQHIPEWLRPAFGGKKAKR